MGDPLRTSYGGQPGPPFLPSGHSGGRVRNRRVARGEFGNGSEGLFAYGKRVVTERFGQVNLLFGLDLLIKGVVGAFNRTLNFLTGLLPIPGLQSVMGIVNAIVRAATTYIDETIFSYILARGDGNAWRSSKDALIYYAQHSQEILKTAVWVVMLVPAFLLLAVLPSGWAPGGTIAGLVVGALFASNIRQAFLTPIFLVMVMTTFHVLVRNQAINLEWDQRLSSVSRKFGEIKEKAAEGGIPAEIAAGVRQSEPATGRMPVLTGTDSKRIA